MTRTRDNARLPSREGAIRKARAPTRFHKRLQASVALATGADRPSQEPSVQACSLAQDADPVAEGCASQQEPLPRNAADLLTEFDFDVRYGPFLGIERLSRWERAHRLGLSPPILVRNILKNSQESSRPETPLW